MKEDNSDNSLITPDSTNALDILMDLVLQGSPNSSDYNIANYEIVEKYTELIAKSDAYSPTEKEKVKKLLASSRGINQLNAEDLAKYANDLNVGLDYLLDREDDKER